MRDPKEEILVKLNNEIHIAPLGVLYVDNFANFVNGNIIDMDAMNALEARERMQVKDRLFDFFCNSITLYVGESDYEHIEEVKAICARMHGTDYLIKYLIGQGKYEEASRRMDAFSMDILRLSDKMFARHR